MIWQAVSEILKVFGSYIYKKQSRSRTLWIGGSGSLVTFLFALILLTGVSMTSTGDITCGEVCESYVNITTTYWRMCFDDSFSPIYTTSDIKTELYVPTYGRKWRLFDSSRDCVERGKVNKFKIVGYKGAGDTVKWGMNLNTIFKDDLDPVWFGDTSYASNDTNLTQETGFAHLNVTDPNIMLYMTFDRNQSTTTYDYTNKSNDGTVTNSDWTASGRYGGAFELNKSDDYILVNDGGSDSLNISGAMSASFWYKRIGPTGAAQTMIAKGGNGWYAPFDIAIADNGAIFFYQSQNGAGWHTIIIATGFTDSNWHHVAFTNNLTLATVYVDGVSIGTDATPATSHWLTHAEVTIGAAKNPTNDAVGRFANGTIDEVMIWNRSLTAEEINNTRLNLTSRFKPTGQQEFQNLVFGLQDYTVNITIAECQTNERTNLSAQINNGDIINFTVNSTGGCFIGNYPLTGISTTSNLTIYYHSDNNSFYSPLLVGNITLEEASEDDPCTGTAQTDAITNCCELSMMRLAINNDYTLQNNINCSNTTTWNSGKGFNPVGNSTTQFTGTIDGQGYNISNLFINRISLTNVGLFGLAYTSAQFKNVGLLNVNITGNDYVGGLYGNTGHTTIIVNNSFVTGSVTAKGTISYVGGIGGKNLATISNSYSNVHVTGVGYAGGITGRNFFWIKNSYAIGNITTAAGGTYTGGIAGLQNGHIVRSYYKGNIVCGGSTCGGLVGANNGKINNSYSSGSVITSSSYVGGFVARNSGGTINHSYTNMNVTAPGISSFMGGFIGRSDGNSKIDNSYSTGNTTPSSGTWIGGFMGYQDTTGVIYNSYWNNNSANPSVCVQADNGPSTDCTAIDNDELYFYDDTNSPMDVWDFINIWVDRVTDYPCLKWDSTCIPGFVDNGPTIHLSLNDTMLEFNRDHLLSQCNVTDDINVSTILYNITYPNGSILLERTIWNVSVVLTPENLTVTGIWNVSCWANDSLNQATLNKTSFVVFTNPNITSTTIDRGPDYLTASCTAVNGSQGTLDNYTISINGTGESEWGLSDCQKTFSGLNNATHYEVNFTVYETSGYDDTELTDTRTRSTAVRSWTPQGDIDMKWLYRIQNLYQLFTKYIFFLSDDQQSQTRIYQNGSNLEFFNNGTGVFNFNNNVTANVHYAEAYYHNHTGEVLTFATQYKYYNVSLNEFDMLNGFEEGVDRLICKKEGLYDASYHMIGSGQNNHRYVSIIGLNGQNTTAVLKTEDHKKMTAGGDLTGMDGQGFIRLAVDDEISLMVKDEGGTGAGVYVGSNLKLLRVGD